ncbi:hypothetical protein FSF33_023105, partial [Escherichia coli]|nr:hypothetical protein [Escherichia coli]
NSDTSLIRSLYRNFTHHYIKAKRSIGVAAGESKSATEIIAVAGPRCWIGFDPSRGVDCSAVYGVRAAAFPYPRTREERKHYGEA